MKNINTNTLITYGYAMSFRQNDIQQKEIIAYQVEYSSRLIISFIYSILIVNIFIAVNFNFRFPDYINCINFSISINFFILLLSLLGIRISLKKQFDTQNLYFIHKIICLSIGICLGLLIYTLYIYIPLHHQYLQVHDIFYIVLILLVAVLLSSLSYLTQRLVYFFLVVLPTCFPILLIQPTQEAPSNSFIPVSLNFIFMMVCLCAISVNRGHKKHTKRMLEQKNLTTYHNNKLKKLQSINQKLSLQLNTSYSLEKELSQKNENLINQYIHGMKQHVYDYNQLFEKQCFIMELTHRTSAIHTWEWNILESTLEVNNQFFSKLQNDATISMQLSEIVHVNDLKNLVSQLTKHFTKQRNFFECRCRIKYKNQWVWGALVGQVTRTHTKTQEPITMLGIFKNIEKEKRNQDRIEQSVQITQHIDVGIITLDANLNYTDANPFFCTITGLSKNQIIGRGLFDITDDYHTQQRSLHYSITDELLKNSQFKGEFEETFMSGKRISIRCHIHAIKDRDEHIIQYIGIISDLTDYKQQEQRLDYLENYDVTTQLPNRFYYNYKLYQFLITHRENIKKVAIIYLSIDRFHALEEFLGNKITGMLLRHVAKRLKTLNPHAFMIAYLNREEFAIVYELNHLRPSIQQLCGDIIAGFAQPFSFEEQELILTVSLGVTLYPEHALDFDQLNHHASHALRQAQHLGGNTVQYYAQEKNGSYIQDLNLENELRQAIKNGELEVYYQPKIHLKEHIISGFEALIRWNHPRQGLLSPAYFLPFAKQTSLISDIGRYVIEASIKQLKAWELEGLPPVTISINVDPQQLYRGQLLHIIDTFLEKYQVDGKYLELEITESSLIEKTLYVQSLLQQLKQRHIALSLDDFGTGYSSLAYLTEFPFDIIKIDRQFIQNMDQISQKAILNAIIAMGKAMDLKIVAEGVETKEQLEFFRQKECDIVQGYIYSKPLSPNNASDYLKHFLSEQ